MKRKLFILLISILGISINANAYDFSSIINGQTLYFNITSNTFPYNVEVTSQSDTLPYYTTKPIGAVTIPDTISYNGTLYSVTSIGNHAFDDCSSLSSISIPNSVLSIGNYAFYWCTSLTSLNLSTHLNSIGNYAFHYCQSLTSITLPNTLNSIGNYAFSNCSSLISVVIPNTVTSLGDYAFTDCHWLESINLPDSITSVPDGIFSYCYRLITTNIPISVTSIGEEAFYDCNDLSSISIPDSLISIGDYAFWGCNVLPSITLPNSLISIGNKAFVGCHAFTSITIPNSVTSIGNNAFGSCTGLVSIILPNSITSIEYYTFGSCNNLTSITIPNSVTSIGSDAFSGCFALRSINLSNSLTSIGDRAFNDAGLTSITLPASLQTLGVYSLSCPELTYIISYAISPPVTYIDAFTGVIKTIPVYVPLVSLQLYPNSPNWNEFTNYHAIESYQIINASFCQGDNYTNYGANTDTAGTYFLVYNNDSIHLNLSVSPTYIDTINASICQGNTYSLNGFNASTTGIYRDTLQTINGCDSIITLNLTVNEITTPTNLVLDNIQNYFELSFQSDAESYLIYRNNDSIGSTTNTIYRDTNVIEGVNYCYKVKAFDGDCETESIEICQVFTGLNDINLNPIQITLYPNPTSSSSKLEIENVEGKVEITITDISGRVIQRMIARANNKFETTLDLTNQSKGIYFISIVTDKTKRTEKLILK